MPQYGGKGTKRQSCRSRLCVQFQEDDEKRREEREAKRAERMAEREATSESRATARQGRARERAVRAASKPSKSAANAEGPASRRLQVRFGGRLAGARVPTLHLPGTLTPGWGMHSTPIGTRVEARLDEEGLADATWAGKVVAVRWSDGDVDSASGAAGAMGGGGGGGGDVGPAAARAAEARGLGELQLCIEFDELMPDGVDVPEEAEEEAEEAEEEDTGERLQEWVAQGDVRERPPSAFPAGVLPLLRVGDGMELYFEDGWWEVELREVLSREAARQRSEGRGGRAGRGVAAAAWRTPRQASAARRATADGGERDATDDDDDGDGMDNAGDAEMGESGEGGEGGEGEPGVGAEERRFVVVASKYNKEHVVSADELRPRWLWCADEQVWRYELLAGHGCVPAGAPRVGRRPTFTFAGGLPRLRTVA